MTRYLCISGASRGRPVRWWNRYASTRCYSGSFCFFILERVCTSTTAVHGRGDLLLNHKHYFVSQRICDKTATNISRRRILSNDTRPPPPPHDIALTHAAFRKEDVHTVKSTIISSLSSTITDRCSVKHCVIEMLKTDLDADLLEVKCNVHPLDGLAHKSRKGLKKVDANLEVKSELFGSECKAANVIYSLLKMRYMQAGKGRSVRFQIVHEEGECQPMTHR